MVSKPLHDPAPSFSFWQNHLPSLMRADFLIQHSKGLVVHIMVLRVFVPLLIQLLLFGTASPSLIHPSCLRPCSPTPTPTASPLLRSFPFPEGAPLCSGSIECTVARVPTRHGVWCRVLFCLYSCCFPRLF